MIGLTKKLTGQSLDRISLGKGAKLGMLGRRAKSGVLSRHREKNGMSYREKVPSHTAKQR